jgi:hypothetical protein
MRRHPSAAVAAPSATGLPPFTVATGDILFNGAGVGPGDDGDIYAVAPTGRTVAG